MARNESIRMYRTLSPKLPSPIEKLVEPKIAHCGVEVFLKRDDLIHSRVSGNKWRKLRLNLDEALSQGQERILTFGGAYSNHIRAVAAAGGILGFSTVGLIRGEEHLPLNPSLAEAKRDGMEFYYVDRAAYRRKTSEEFLAQLKSRFGTFYLVPEGGSNALGVQGCADIAAELDARYDLVVCPSGTGGTLAGLSRGLEPGTQALGIAVLKGAGFLEDDVRRLQHDAFGVATDNWSIELDYHFGGFGKRPADLMAFADDFERDHGFAVERVYVAKMLFAVMDMIRKGRIERGQSVLAVITG